MDAACRKLGSSARATTQSFTLDGRPVGAIPNFLPPSPGLKSFLKTRPRLRELHALGHLGAAFAVHTARRAAGLCLIEGEDAFRRRYE